MNTVTIHAQPRKPLTFADIKAGPFVFEGNACTKFNAATANGWNAVRHHDGELLAMHRSAFVTLPDAPPQQDDTVAYGDLKPGEMFEFDNRIWQVGNDGQAQRLFDGFRSAFQRGTRVRRVHSVTITREESK